MLRKGVTASYFFTGYLLNMSFAAWSSFARTTGDPVTHLSNVQFEADPAGVRLT